MSETCPNSCHNCKIFAKNGKCPYFDTAGFKRAREARQSLAAETDYVDGEASNLEYNLLMES